MPDFFPYCISFLPPVGCIRLILLHFSMLWLYSL